MGSLCATKWGRGKGEEGGVLEERKGKEAVGGGRNYNGFSLCKKLGWSRKKSTLGCPCATNQKEGGEGEKTRLGSYATKWGWAEGEREAD